MIAKPKSKATACSLSNGNEVIYAIIKIKYKKYNKQCEKDQQTYKVFDKFYRKPLQGNLIDENEHERLCNVFIKYVDESKNEFFLKNKNIIIKLIFLVIIN